MIFVGNDWAEGHHDVYLLDEGGTRLGFARTGRDPRYSQVPPDGRRARRMRLR